MFSLLDEPFIRFLLASIKKLTKHFVLSVFFLNFTLESSLSTSWASVFKTYWFDKHTYTPRVGDNAMISRKDVYETLVFYYWKSGKFSKCS